LKPPSFQGVQLLQKLQQLPKKDFIEAEKKIKIIERNKKIK